VLISYIDTKIKCVSTKYNKQLCLVYWALSFTFARSNAMYSRIVFLAFAAGHGHGSTLFLAAITDKLIACRPRMYLEIWSIIIKAHYWSASVLIKSQLLVEGSTVFGTSARYEYTLEGSLLYMLAEF